MANSSTARCFGLYPCIRSSRLLSAAASSMICFCMCFIVSQCTPVIFWTVEIGILKRRNELIHEAARSLILVPGYLNGISSQNVLRSSGICSDGALSPDPASSLYRQACPSASCSGCLGYAHDHRSRGTFLLLYPSGLLDAASAVARLLLFLY